MERAERNCQAAVLHQRSANVTNMSSSDPASEPDTDFTESLSTEGDSDSPDLAANVNKGSKAHPGDVRQMMGKQPTKKSPSSQCSGYNVRFDANTIRCGRSSGPNGDHSTLSDKWGGAEQVSSSESVPPFHFRSSDSVSSASDSSGPDEMATWGTAPVPSTAFDELDAWGAASDGDTVSTTQTKNVQRTSVQRSSDPCGIASLWDEDQHFC